MELLEGVINGYTNHACITSKLTPQQRLGVEGKKCYMVPENHPLYRVLNDYQHHRIDMEVLDDCENLRDKMEGS